jgi:hypothetical protein
MRIGSIGCLLPIVSSAGSDDPIGDERKSDLSRSCPGSCEILGDLLDYARKSRPSVRHLLASTRTRSFYSKEREEGVRLAVVGCE